MHLEKTKNKKTKMADMHNSKLCKLRTASHHTKEFAGGSQIERISPNALNSSQRELYSYCKTPGNETAGNIKRTAS